MVPSMCSLGPRTAVSALGSEEKDTGSGTVSSSGGTGGDILHIPGKHTWRIIPFSKWLITMVGKSPKLGYSPSKWPKWLINRGY